MKVGKKVVELVLMMVDQLAVLMVV